MAALARRGIAGPDTPGIRRLYRYAVEHGDALQDIPCCCGCVNFGRRSTCDCPFTFFNAGGTLTFPSHAAT